MKSAFILIFILNFSIMSAQEEKPRDINNPISLRQFHPQVKFFSLPFGRTNL